MPDLVRMAQIGVGGFGRHWVNALAACPRARTVALVDIDPDAMVEPGWKLGVPAERQFVTHEDLLEVEFDAAIVCVPVAARAAIYETLAEAGKSILAEKPLAGSIEDARAALRLKRDHGIHFVVSQNFRHDPTVQALKHVLSGGRYGRPCACQVDFFKFPRFFGFRETMPYPLIIDMSVHHFDMARFLLEADPLGVVGMSWSGPWSVMQGDAASTVVFEMAGGVHLTYNSSWTTLRPPQLQTAQLGNWYVECEHGCVVMTEGQVTGWRWHLETRGLPSWAQAEPVPITEVAHGQLRVLRQFLDEVTGEGPAPTTIEDNIQSIAMVFAAVRAFEQKTSIDVRALLEDEDGNAK